MEFRDAVKYLRSELGLTQVELAMGLHINAITVGRWENGRTLPTRSITSVLLDFAHAKGASKECLDILSRSIHDAARSKLDFSGDGEHSVENASLRQLIDDAVFAVCVCDLMTDEILYVNRKANELFGAEGSAVGKKCYACLMHRGTPCEFCHKSALADDACKNCGVVRFFNGVTYRVQGKRIWWNGHSAHEILIFDNDAPQQPSVETEITAERLKTIFENINGGVSVVVYEDDGAVRYAYANDRYYALFGYTKEQFAEELITPHDTTYPDDRAYVQKRFAEAKETKQPATFCYRVVKRDQSVAYIRCNLSFTTIDGVSGYVLISILTDITASVQHEQRAIVYGQRLDAIMKNMTSAVTASLVKNDGTVEFLFSNDLYHEMFGYTKAQYQTEVQEPCQIIHPDDVDAVRDAVFSLHRVGDAKELQYRAVTRDGTIKWLRAQITMMTFPDADEPVQLAIYSDITDAVEAQQQLAAQRDQIAELLNNTPSGIAIVEVDPNDIAGTMLTVYYNDRFFSYSGYDRDEYQALLKNNELAFVLQEDIPALLRDTATICAGDIGASADTTVRCHTKDGGFRWLLLTGQLAERRGDICVINIVVMDVTERQEAIERQRISEEMLRIAAETDQRSMIVYDVKSNTCRVESRTLYSAKYGEIFENIPRSLIDRGLVAPDSEDVLCSLFARIRKREKQICVSLQLRSGPDEYEWFECNAATVFDNEGVPDHAILVFHNITEQRLKEAVFKKWQQSIDARPPESYSLFRCNLSRDASFDKEDGSLLHIAFPADATSFNSRTKYHAEEFVYPDDRDAYIRLLDSDLLIAMFHRGEHYATMDYRETAENGEAKWRRLTVETVEFPNSTDIQAFLMYEDIDEEKKAELAALELAKSDPLTGALNRSAFAEKVNEVISVDPNSPCALIMIDMDGFKKLNDTFGHAAGDQALQEVASVLRAYSRSGDLVCRLGGDEFLVWLRDVPYDAVIGKTAQQICEHIRKAYSREVLLSASAGIAVYPRDGRSYDELYHNADKALYRVKQSGKGSYAFFSVCEKEQTEAVEQALPAVTPSARSLRNAKRRMLIVDDNEINRVLLKDIFKNEFLIETAKNGAEAMIRLRHFGVSVSVVLLDLIMPGVDGFTVLKRMQSDDDLRTIPVIVVTGDEEHATLLKAFELGAAEYVAKPVDVDIIRMRVQAVISKAENERLRAQNSYLMLQRDEEVKYRTVLESTGTVVVEYDWRNHVFIYDGEITKYIAGNYDHRGLWQVFLSDMVADSADVKVLQDTLLELANNREREQDSKLVRLKTPAGVKHWFRMNIFKSVDEFGLAEKLIIAFNDVNHEVLANEKLLFRATRDELTGLYNRAGFFEKAAELIAAKEPGYYVMACIDIEKFKVYNDQYGARKGDEILTKFARALEQLHNGERGICCRVMADNFAVLYPTRMLDSPELANSHTAVEHIDSMIPRIEYAVGRCIVDDKALDIGAIYDRAFIAKSTVKGRYDVHVATFDEAMRTTILRQQEITAQMNHALESGQFEVWLQPQFNHTTGMLSGAEALVRWRHPEEGIISPTEFIPIFERNGFVYEMDKYVWEQTCILLRKWLDQGLRPVPVSVNISRYDVFRDDLIGVIEGLITKYDLPLDMLRLEITESAFTESADQIIKVVATLVEKGFTVEIDDFGSGYSSLNTLKDVPAQILKMDMRFLENDRNAQRGGSIIESVVRMAKWLGMSVIAEGVETIEQADYLKSIGCKYIQGYLYARPARATEYERLFAEGKTESMLGKIRAVDTWNNNAFWDPSSMETLIFNSYVGGACIFELCKGKTELLRINERYCSALGALHTVETPLEEASLRQFLHGDETEKAIAYLHRTIKSKHEESCELCLTDGTHTEYIRMTGRLLASVENRYLFYAVIQNITEQRELERERAESAERLSIILRSIDCGVSASIFHVENHIDIIFANDGFYRLFGYTKEQFETDVLNAIDPVLPEDRDRIQETIARILRERGSATYEYRCRKRDGSVVWVQTTNTVVSLAGMGETVLLAATTDITGLRRAEELSLETADRLSAVMNAMTNGMTAVSFSGNGQEFLFANDRYYQLHGVEKESCRQDGFIDSMKFVCSEDRKRVSMTAMQTTEVGQSNEIEYRVACPDGSLRWIKALITVTNLIGVDMPVQVTVYTDITDERKVSEQLRFLNESAGEILAQPDSERAIQDTLQKLLHYFAGERSYIFELNDELQTSDNTYEICAPGVTPEIERLKGVPYPTQQYWFDAFRKTGFVAIPDVSAIEEDESAMRELLLVQNIRSIIVVPLWRDGKLIGYMGVDNPAAAVDQVSQLIALTDYIAVLMTRRDLMKTVKRERQIMQQLVDDTPGGFLRMEIFEDKAPAVITVNNGLCKMLGMTKAELMEAYGDNALACLAEEDAEKAPEEMKQAYASGKQYTSTCCLRKKDGKLFWVLFFGRFVRGESGKLYLNAHLTDITEQKSMEQLQIDLLDNLPFGAAMYEFDGKSLTAIHINRQYSEMVNRDVDISLAGFAPIDAIHPDDRMRVLDKIRAAIAQKRNAACDIRLRYGRDEYRLFHLDARIVPGGNGKYMLYVAYARITDRDKELKETSERLKLLSDSIPGGLATFRCLPGNIEPIFYNDGVCALTGYSREEFDQGRVSILSLIFDEDKPSVRKQIELLTNGETALDYFVRIHTKDGGYKWVECMASVTGREGENVFLISAVLTDVTEHQEEHERLCVSEELNRLAIDQSGKIISRYDVASRTLTLPYTLPDIFTLPQVLKNMPEEQVRLGRISPDTADVYREVFRRIHGGEASGEAVYQQSSALGWRWLKSQFTTVFGSDGKPVSAVISFEDITEQREKEAIYSRWQNAMAERPRDSFTVVRCNLNQTNIVDSWEGSLLRIRFIDPAQPFNARTAEYAERFVHADDRAAFRAFLNSDTMLAEYHRGHRSDSIDYREQYEDGSVRWLRLSVDLVEYQDSTDVEAYLLYEDIDEQKHAELSTIRRAETDPLTGVLNRTAFTERVNEAIDRFGSHAYHALFMMDVDGFKQVNDVFGHGAGDQLLIDIANALTQFCRKEDLVGKLGGDEFFVFLSNIGSAGLAARKARQICDMMRKTLSVNVHVSASIGVALHPQDGDDFEALYRVADAALYRTKNGGKDGYSISSGDPVIGAGASRRDEQSSAQNAAEQKQRTRRILIVDDNKTEQTMLQGILKEEYLIEKATDGVSALAMLHHYGTAISVVLLDLMMPGMNGFEVLEKIRQDERIRTIPVIVVSADEDRETTLRVIRAGASDFVTKPVDPTLLRIRVRSAVSKSENERLRAQNSYLSIRSTEADSYRAALERTGTMVITLDRGSQSFSYSSTVSRRLAGEYDERPFWSILLEDQVTDEQTVRKMQQLVQEIMDDQERTDGNLRVRLQTRSGYFHMFELHVFEALDDYGAASKMLMTLQEAAPSRVDD